MPIPLTISIIEENLYIRPFIMVMGCFAPFNTGYLILPYFTTDTINVVLSQKTAKMPLLVQ